MAGSPDQLGATRGRTRNSALKVGAAGAAIVCLSVAAIGLVMRAVPADISFQPSEAATPLTEILRPTKEFPAAALRFFAADSVLLIGYLMAFVGLRAASALHANRLGTFGLAVGIVMACSDAVENSIYSLHALSVMRGSPPQAVDTHLLYRVNGLKEICAGIAFLAFSLALPRAGRLSRLVAGLLLLAPVVRLLVLFMPAMVPILGWTIVVPMPFLAVMLWRRSHLAGPQESSRPAFGA